MTRNHGWEFQASSFNSASQPRISWEMKSGEDWLGDRCDKGIEGELG